MKNKGITLVALVITIIILLILSGITIAQLTGSGLFENARLAESEYKNAQEKENDILSEYESLIDSNRAALDANLNDDLKNWISKLDDKNISLEDITNNELLDRLMNSKKAVDYMFENDNIMNAVLKGKNAMEALGKSDYAGYVAIMNANLKEKILSSEYVSYFDAGSAQVPTLSSNDTNIIYSKVNSGGEAYKIFDKNLSTYWWTPNTSSAEYIGYNFGKNVIPYKVEIVNLISSGYYRCKNFTVQASTDGNNYIDLTSNLVALETSEVQTFNITNTQKFQYIRLNILDKYIDAKSTGLVELQIYCREVPSDI